MGNDRPDLKTVWSTQDVEGFSMPLDEIRAKSAKFQKRVRNRNRREYIAALFVVVVFACYAVFLPGLIVKIGCGLVIAGTLFVAWQLHRRTSMDTPPLGESVVEYVAFHRSELVRQRDALKSVAAWYLAPLVPGLAVFMYGIFSLVPIRASAVWGLVLSLAIVVAVFAGVWRLNRWAAARMQKQIDALDRKDA